MSEEQFWMLLEYRICSELGHYWGDGFDTQDYHLDRDPPCITGNASICYKQETYEKWFYTLVINQDVRRREEIDWSSLLPDKKQAGWVALEPG